MTTNGSGEEENDENGSPNTDLTTSDYQNVSSNFSIDKQIFLANLFVKFSYNVMGKSEKLYNNS